MFGVELTSSLHSWRFCGRLLARRSVWTLLAVPSQPSVLWSWAVSERRLTPRMKRNDTNAVSCGQPFASKSIPVPTGVRDRSWPRSHYLSGNFHRSL